MSRLLIRAGKSPFTAVSPATTLTQDVFNNNTGNFLFQHAVWQALATDGTEIVANATLSERREAGDRDAAAINESFDHFVIPFAHAFRPDFADQLDRLASLVERLTIPVSVVGVGTQAPADLDLSGLGPAREATRRFVAAVLDRSPSIGVRGDVTRRLLLELGFDDASIEVIGCPSLFRHGPDFRVDRTLDRIGPDSRLALNLTPEVPGIGGFALTQAARHPHLTYVGQDGHDLRLMLWGVPRPNVSDPDIPVHLDHPLLTSDRMRMFVDQWTWFDFLATQDFAYGTRFHGTVAALMAGTPAMLLAHDSRTLELAEYHQMPHRTTPAFDADVRVEDLYEATDLTAFHTALRSGFERYSGFLARHGLTHRWTPGTSHTAFDAHLAAARFPEAVRPVTAPDLREVVDRINWIRGGMVLDITRHPERFTYDFEHPTYAGAGSRHARRMQRLEDAVARQEKELAELRTRVRRLEKWRPRSILQAIRVRLARLGGR